MREILTDDKFVLLGKLPRILPAKVERLRKLRVELDQAQIRAQVTQRAYEESKHQFEIERQKHLAALNDLPVSKKQRGAGFKGGAAHLRPKSGEGKGFEPATGWGQLWAQR